MQPTPIQFPPTAAPATSAQTAFVQPPQAPPPIVNTTPLVRPSAPPPPGAPFPGQVAQNADGFLPVFDPEKEDLLQRDDDPMPGTYLARLDRISTFMSRTNVALLKFHLTMMGEIDRVPNDLLPAHLRGLPGARTGSSFAGIVKLSGSEQKYVMRDIASWIAALNRAHVSQLQAAHVQKERFLGDIYSGRFLVVQAEHVWKKDERTILEALRAANPNAPIPPTIKGLIVTSPRVADDATLERFGLKWTW